MCKSQKAKQTNNFNFKNFQPFPKTVTQSQAPLLIQCVKDKFEQFYVGRKMGLILSLRMQLFFLEKQMKNFQHSFFSDNSWWVIWETRMFPATVVIEKGFRLVFLFLPIRQT